MRKLLAFAVAALAFAAPARASFGPSAVLFHPSARLTAPLSSIGDVSTAADLDSTLSVSYGGTGTAWTSLISAPSDGTTQAANAFTTNATFTGGPGQPTAYFAQSGSSNAALTGAATALLAGLQNDTSSWWVTMTFNLASTASTFLWSTQANSSSAGVTLIINAGGSPKFNLAQYTTASKQIVAWSPTASPMTGAEYIVIVSHSSGGNTRVWFNSAANTVESSTTFTAAALTGNKITFGSRNTSGFMPAGGRISHISYGTGYLGNAQAGEIIHLLESRHQVDYDGNGNIGN